MFKLVTLFLLVFGADSVENRYNGHYFVKNLSF